MSKAKRRRESVSADRQLLALPKLKRREFDEQLHELQVELTRYRPGRWPSGRA
jgi:hypothetical protein